MIATSQNLPHSIGKCVFYFDVYFHHSNLLVFIDEFAGKGLDAEIILKFLTYYSPKLYPLVMPLSVLLASIMTYGAFAENYEFAAMKSTGISLQRALLGLLFFTFFRNRSYFFPIMLSLMENLNTLIYVET